MKALLPLRLCCGTKEAARVLMGLSSTLLVLQLSRNLKLLPAELGRKGVTVVTSTREHPLLELALIMRKMMVLVASREAGEKETGRKEGGKKQKTSRSKRQI
ncbi:hypothetical protein PRIPAC_95421 [Pristionchus pacificus]|uniref:Uncharacterized protein n=1 Tax=Pristionchus pacificus TaxID=54126 RepID=A0A2A6BIR6_PRIPA|nr:hypothetical protein PRIPAC_95421 [Pristionchus pacificus]|eukprot:PDM65800.1 hypothetical protein PRIPAC_45201 [Pristionchus pacificus]